MLLDVALIALFAGPVLALIALMSVRHLERKVGVSQIQELTSRVYALELLVKQLASREVQPGEKTILPSEDSLRAERPEPPPVAPVAGPPSPMTQPAPSASEGGGVSASGVLQPIPKIEEPKSPDLESVIGGRWLNRIGIVALLIAVSYFLKLAFDNNWIGPSGRVAIGILLGAFMLPWSQWLSGRGYTYFSDGIAALGEATLFLSVWAGCQYYSLYSRVVGFAAMITVTVVMAAIAIGRNSQGIAVMSLLGGLLVPVLASSGRDEQAVLFTYLLLLGAGALATAAKNKWNSLAPIAFIGTQIYFWGWYNQFFQRTLPLERTVVFASLFFLLYSLLPISKAILGTVLHEVDILVVLMSEFAYSGAVFVLLWPDNKWPLTLLFVALAAAHVGVAHLLPAPSDGQSGTARLLFAGLALTYLTLAIPVRLEGKWITLSFAVEGAILVWTGFRTLRPFLRQAGYFLLAVSALRLLFLPPTSGAFFFNARFAAYAVLIACFGVALGAARSHSGRISGQERAEIGVLGVAINIYALIALSTEFWEYFGKASAGMDATLAQHLSLSVLWTIYATVLILFGVQNKSALMRWQGLALFGLVVGKVFLYDLSFLDRVYRILSFFVLGAVLLGVSFLYQRRLARERLE
jgi:uncharacterized membrane protein